MYRAVECRGYALGTYVPCGISGRRGIRDFMRESSRAPKLAPGRQPEKRLFASASSPELFIALEFCRRTASRQPTGRGKLGEGGETRKGGRDAREGREAVCEDGRERERKNNYVFLRYYTYTYTFRKRASRAFIKTGRFGPPLTFPRRLFSYGSNDLWLLSFLLSPRFARASRARARARAEW